MKSLAQVVRGLLAVLFFGAVVLGALSLSLAEGGEAVAALTSAAGAAIPTATVTLAPTVMPGTPSLTPPPTATLTPVPLRPSPTRCPAPAGWLPYTIKSGDTLESLALAYGISADQIMLANCLLAPGLVPGAALYLPAARPTATSTTVIATGTSTSTSAPARPSNTPAPACGAPRGWVQYTVKSGDTLYSLARMFGVTVNQLQAANCMGSSTIIRTGSKLNVPFIPTNTAPPPPTAEPTHTATQLPTVTFTPVPPTVTPTQTETPEPPSPG